MGFNVVISPQRNDSYGDIAMGARGDYRYIVPVFDPNNILKVYEAAVLVSGSAITTPPGPFSGMTSDINAGRHGEYLYVAWRTVLDVIF